MNEQEEKNPADWSKFFDDPDFRQVLDECHRVLVQKGQDYTGHAEGRDGAVRNFMEASKFLGISPLQVFGVYWYKHLSAILSFIKHGQVESEPIEGRICDAINYLLLLSKLIRLEKESSGHFTEQKAP